MMKNKNSTYYINFVLSLSKIIFIINFIRKYSEIKLGAKEISATKLH